MSAHPSRLCAESVSVVLDGRAILRDVTLAVEPGRFTVIMGPNGAGKTTLLKCLSGESRPTHGMVTLDGRPLSTWSAELMARRRAVLPQKSHLSFPFTVFEVVAMGLVPHGGLPQRRRDMLVEEAMDRVGLLAFAGRHYQRLSGGEQQRVQIARVLCQIEGGADDPQARFLLLDEPVSSLDLKHQLLMLDIALEFVRRGGGALAVLHDLNLASLYGDHLVLMHEGAVAEQGSAREVLTTERVRRVFEVPLVLNRVPEGGRPFVLPHSAKRAGEPEPI